MWCIVLMRRNKCRYLWQHPICLFVYLFSGPSIYTEPTSTKPLHTHRVAPHRSYRVDLKTERGIVPLPSVCSWPGVNSGLYQMCALNSHLVTITWESQCGTSLGTPPSLICSNSKKLSKMISEIKKKSCFYNIKHIFLQLLCCLLQHLIFPGQESPKMFH